MKPIIGVLTSININDINRPNSNYYKINELYIRRINENGGSCIGLVELSDSILSLCDAFLIPGGNKITKEHYKLIDYAIKNNKALLGICAGMQALVLYDVLQNECKKSNIDNPTIDDLFDKYIVLRKSGNEILSIVFNHCSNACLSNYSTYAEIIDSNHEVILEDNSLLKKIYGSNIINVISLHKYGYKGALNLFNITGISKDGVIEAIEYNNIIGVQFHAEIKEEDLLIKYLIDAKKDAYY